MRGKSSESDCEYFARRAGEERLAAEAASYEVARDVHLDLAERYQALADQAQTRAAPVLRLVG